MKNHNIPLIRGQDWMNYTSFALKWAQSANSVLTVISELTDELNRS